MTFLLTMSSRTATASVKPPPVMKLGSAQHPTIRNHTDAARRTCVSRRFTRSNI